MGTRAARQRATGRDIVRAIRPWAARKANSLLQRRKTFKLAFLALAACTLAAPQAGGTAVMDRPRPDYDAKGIPLGAFRVFPTLGTTVSTTDNVLEAESGAESDVYLTLAPAVRLVSEWSQHALEFFARADVLRHADNDSEDVADWTLGARGRLDVRRTTYVSAELWQTHQHERRASPNSPGNIAEPIRFDRAHAEAGISFQPNHLRLFLGAAFDDFAYDDTPLSGGGILSNRDRDHDEIRLQARISLEVSEGFLVFAEAVRDRRDFDLPLDRNGVNRDSRGSFLNAGVSFDMADLLQGDLFVGFLDRQFGAPLQDVSGLNYGASLTWSATELTTVRLSANRLLNDTTLAATSVSSDKSFGVGVDHELRRNVILRADVSIVDSDFVGTPRNDEIFSARIGASYLIDENWRASAGFERRECDSNSPGDDYVEDRVDVGLQFQF